MAVVTKQELEDASLDTQTLEDVINGAADINGTGLVTSRLGQVIKTIAKSIQDLNTAGVVVSAISSLEVEIGAPASSLVIKADGKIDAPNGVKDSLSIVGGASPTLTITSDDAASTAKLDLQPTGGGGSVINAGGATNLLILQTNDVERGRIDAAGNLLIAKTVPGPATQGVELNANGTAGFTRDGDVCQVLNRTTSDGVLVSIRQDGSEEGSISITGATTAYNTTSDYRKKENIVPMTGATARLLQLKPSTFNFISHPDRTVDGFIAHEAQAVVPEAVIGEKDEMQTVVITPAVLDGEGNEITPAVTEEQPKYQQIDQSKLVPLLVATLQELEARIDTLEA